MRILFVILMTTLAFGVWQSSVIAGATMFWILTFILEMKTP